MAGEAVCGEWDWPLLVSRYPVGRVNEAECWSLGRRRAYQAAFKSVSEAKPLSSSWPCSQNRRWEGRWTLVVAGFGFFQPRIISTLFQCSRRRGCLSLPCYLKVSWKRKADPPWQRAKVGVPGCLRSRYSRNGCQGAVRLGNLSVMTFITEALETLRILEMKVRWEQVQKTGSLPRPGYHRSLREPVDGG